MSVLMRIVAGAAALAALVLSASTASACCFSCGCGGGYGYGYPTAYQAVTFLRPVAVYAPVQPTYWADQGPAYDVPAPVVTGPVQEEIGYGYG